MTKTKIPWTNKTWNPVTGCTKCSPGCENCYAEAMARRLQKMHPKKYKYGFRVTHHVDSLGEPLQWKKPCMIFVCSMGDLFHKEVAFAFIRRMMSVIEGTPHHTYQILTKRPERMKEYFEKKNDYLPAPNNVWLGVTICNQEEADEKIPVLLQIPATVRFVSIEPMLREIDLMPWLVRFRCFSCKGETTSPVDGFVCPHCKEECMGSQHFSPALDWIICGGETGANARSMNPDWARLLRDQCQECGIPFFFKQWGTWGEDGVRRSKKQNGALLDGKSYQEWPKGEMR